MRFPMILGIVLIHLHFVIPDTFRASHDLWLYQGFASLLYDGPTRIFVPLFFFISGYLFFNGEFNLTVYTRKLKKRFSSLVVPYILYITIAIAIFFVAQTLLPSLISEGKTAIKDYGIHDFLEAYGIGGLPFVGPFWFIRNLFLIVVASPLVYLILRYLRVYGLILLGIVWLTDAGFWTFIPAAGDVFFFTTGAYFSYNKIGFTDSFNKIKWLTFLYIPILAYCYYAHQGQETFAFRLGIIFGLMFFVVICHKLMLGGAKTSELLTASSFMIFALHEPYLDQIDKIVFRLLPVVNSDILLNIEYIIALAIIGFAMVTAIVLLNKVLNIYAPCLAKILNGNR